MDDYMKIVQKRTRRNGEVFYQLAAWIIDHWYSFGPEFESRIDAVLSERRRYMREVVKTETAT